MKEKTKDTLIRALRTFWQAALAYLFTDAAVLQRALSEPRTGREILLSLFIGAVAAGLSAIYNSLVYPLLVTQDGK